MFNFASPVSLKQRLTTQDASFLYAESNSGPLHIGALGIFDGELPFAKLVRHIEQRLHLIPRYRQRLAQVPLNLHHATWEDDPNFKLENHIKRHKLGKSASEAAMMKAAMKIYEKPLDRNRPLWEMHLLEGLEGGRTATVWKIHHCMVDGVSGVELTTVILDFQRDAPPPKPPQTPWEPVPFPGAAERLSKALRERIRANIQVGRSAVSLLSDFGTASERAGQVGQALRSVASMIARPIVGAPWNLRLVTQSRQFAWSRFPFAGIRAIRAALGGTVNDVVLTMLSEAAARYLRHHGFRTEGQILRIGCPVNVRHEDERSTLGNRVSMMFPEFPATPMDPVARLPVTIQETNRIKVERAPQALDTLMNALDIAPPSLLGLLSGGATLGLDLAARLAAFIPVRKGPPLLSLPGFGLNFVATNVPGVQVPQYIAGRECVDSIGMVPLGATLGYGVAITSYNQKLYFGMMAEPRAMPDVDLMKHLVEQVHEELQKAGQAASAADLSDAAGKKAGPAVAAPAASAGVEAAD